VVFGGRRFGRGGAPFPLVALLVALLVMLSLAALFLWAQPALSAPTLSTITFAGDASNPQVTIAGAGFGTEPAPSNLALTGYTGYDYGLALYICDTSPNPAVFCAGHNDGAGGVDLIGLVVTTYSDTQIAYSFGSTYTTSYYPNSYDLQQGDQFTVHVAGVTCSGTVSYGNSVACTSGSINPTVTTGPATQITTTTATLTGTINPEGGDFPSYFEYGPSNSYGMRAPAGSTLDPGSGTTAVPVSVNITGLLPNTTYHYQLVAQNGSVGYQRTFGADATFTTTTCTAPAATTTTTAGHYAQAVLADHPTAYYQFNDATNSPSMADSSGNCNTGSLYSPLVAAGPLGPGSGAAALSGGVYGGDEPLTPALAPTQGDNARTIELWFQTTQENECLVVVGRSNIGGFASSQAFNLCLTDGHQGSAPPPNAPGVYLETGSADIYVPNLSLADGKWHYIAATLSGSTVTIVVDGQAPPTGFVWNGVGYSGATAQPFTLTSQPNTSTGQVDIGGHGDGHLALWFTGQIGEVAIYPTALPVAQLAAHYVAGGGDVVTTTGVSGFNKPGGDPKVQELQLTNNLTGQITPGFNSKPLSYYFEYSTDPTFACKNPTNPPLLCYQYPESGTIAAPSGLPTWSGRVQVCIGGHCLHETPAPVDHLSATIRPDPSGAARGPVRWFAQLVAVPTDGVGPPVYGGVVPFTPGGLINPPGFNVSPTTDPGEYKLTISCPTACAELDNGHGPISGSADGVLHLTLVDRSAGRVSGTITDLGGPARFYYTTYAVTGTIALSVIKLDVSPSGCSGDPELCGRPPPPFTLNGAVTYGGPSGSGYDYQASFRGPIAGAADKWKACFTQYQGTCTPSSSSVKGGANAMSAALAFVALIPVVGEVAYTLAVVGAVTTAIGLDPPDRHYKLTVLPARAAPVYLPAIRGLSHRAATAATGVLSALEQASADGTTFVVALQRYEGAVKAGDAKWLAIQLKATLRYGRLTAAWSRRAATLLARDHHLLARSPLGWTRVDTRALKRSLGAIRKHGLPTALVQQLRAWGIDATTIRAIGKHVPTVAPPGASTLWGPILQPSYRGRLENFVRIINDYLTALRQRPFA
jgi:hypothetical protein